MSFLERVPDVAVHRAAERFAVYTAEQARWDRELVRRLAWELWRRFKDETVRVPLFWGMRWTVKLGDLRPLWVMLFGEEVPAITYPPLDEPPPEPLRAA